MELVSTDFNSFYILELLTVLDNILREYFRDVPWTFIYKTKKPAETVSSVSGSWPSPMSGALLDSYMVF